MRVWGSAGGHRRDFMVGCPLAAAAVASCSVQPDWWIVPHLAVRTYFECARWSVRHFGLLLGCLPWTQVQALNLPSRDDAAVLDVSLDAGDVSRAWLVWSSAAETALADAHRFAGGLCLKGPCSG